VKRPAESRWLRIDDRLLHGQVLVAWAAALRPHRIVLASDEVAADPERRAIYAALPHDEAEIDVVTLAAAGALLRGGDRLLVVCGSPADARRIVESGADLDRIHIGGLHHADGKRRWLDYAWLSHEDAEHLRALLERGVRVEARDLPGARGVPLDVPTLVALWSRGPGESA
jgi:mannose/fructose/N-acetylgalactosamine-specific phosphotransferase system component IIB